MWRAHVSRRQRETCPACGRRVTRDDAREYDKYGDRWDRDEKTFEYFCRPCHDALCHHRRPELEAILTEVGAGEVGRDRFVREYTNAAEGRSGHPEDH